jgi:hypothetical protein
MAKEAKRAPNGRFEKGHRKVGGRRKGTPNVFSRDLKQAIVNALTKIGRDGNGTDGLQGFIERAARKDVKHGVLLAARLLPLSVHSENREEVVYRTVSEIRAAFRAEGIEPTRELLLLAKDAEDDEEDQAGDAVETRGEASKARGRTKE